MSRYDDSNIIDYRSSYANCKSRQQKLYNICEASVNNQTCA